MVPDPKYRFNEAIAAQRRLLPLLLHIALLVGSISPSVGHTIYEAENATLSGPSVATNNAGYSGTGWSAHDFTSWRRSSAAIP